MNEIWSMAGRLAMAFREQDADHFRDRPPREETVRVAYKRRGRVGYGETMISRVNWRDGVRSHIDCCRVCFRVG